MPKRKADETADDAVGVPGGEKIISPNANPRKKSKKEALAAARDWHDARSSSSSSSGGVVVVVDGGGASAGPIVVGESTTSKPPAKSPVRKDKKEAHAAAKDWHDAKRSSTTSGGALAPVVHARTGAVGGVKMVAVQSRIAASRSDENECAAPAPAEAVDKRMHEDAASTQSALHRDAKPTTKGGGKNAFLKSLRAVEGGEKELASNSVITTTTTMTTSTAPSTAPSTGGSSTRFSSKVVCFAKEYLGIVSKALLFLILFALNIATAIVAIVVIRGSSSSFDALREQHASEVDGLETGLTKSREVEALLRSGVRVLEREMMARRDARGESGLADVLAIYGIRTDTSILDDDDANYALQSLEERNHWLEGMRALEEERKLGMEKLDSMRNALFETGRFRWEEDGSPN